MPKGYASGLLSDVHCMAAAPDDAGKIHTSCRNYDG